MDNTLWDELEERVGLKSGTFRNLFAEQSDWARIIKAHALVEAAVNARVVARFPQLAEVLVRLPIDDARFGKIKILEQVDWLERTESDFIRAVKDVRNRLVHDIRYLDFSLTEESDRWPQSRTAFWRAVYQHWKASLNERPNEAEFEHEYEVPEQLLFAAVFRFIFDTDDLLREWTRRRDAEPPN